MIQYDNTPVSQRYFSRWFLFLAEHTVWSILNWNFFLIQLVPLTFIFELICLCREEYFLPYYITFVKNLFFTYHIHMSHAMCRYFIFNRTVILTFSSSYLNLNVPFTFSKLYFVSNWDSTFVIMLCHRWKFAIYFLLFKIFSLWIGMQVYPVPGIIFHPSATILMATLAY